jgi:hypothetical protein
VNFQLTKDEVRRLKEWDELHINTHHGGKDPDNTAIGGRLTFGFTPTSLGTILIVSCSCKKDSCDLTDYDSW